MSFPAELFKQPFAYAIVWPSGFTLLKKEKAQAELLAKSDLPENCGTIIPLFTNVQMIINGDFKLTDISMT